MLKKVKQKMEKYMYENSIPSYDTSNWQEQCYIFGYLDGYFNENLYKTYITNDQKNQEKINHYQTGYNAGTKDRDKQETNTVNKEKQEWLKRIALFDFLNQEPIRNLKKDSLKIYKKNLVGTYSIAKSSFIDEKTNKKR